MVFSTAIGVQRQSEQYPLLCSFLFSNGENGHTAYSIALSPNCGRVAMRHGSSFGVLLLTELEAERARLGNHTGGVMFPTVSILPTALEGTMRTRFKDRKSIA